MDNGISVYFMTMLILFQKTDKPFSTSLILKVFIKLKMNFCSCIGTNLVNTF